MKLHILGHQKEIVPYGSAQYYAINTWNILIWLNNLKTWYLGSDDTCSSPIFLLFIGHEPLSKSVINPSYFRRENGDDTSKINYIN